jgi:hypothetical protein
LTWIKTLHFCNNENIIDKGFGHLKSVHTLDIVHSENITDKNLEFVLNDNGSTCYDDEKNISVCGYNNI